MESTSKYYLIVLILGILQAAIIYSVGRSHTDDKFSFHMPAIREWATIIILLIGLYIVGAFSLIIFVGDDLKQIKQSQ
jgi:hypothetical protein